MNMDSKKVETNKYCCFCTELAKKTTTDFFRIYKGSPSSRSIAQTDNFVILPTIGQLTEGYLLIVTKKHYPSMGHLTSSELQDLEELKQKISAILSSVYSKPIFFEHGPAVEGVGGCGVYHAHLHVVPVAKFINLLDNLISFNGKTIKTLASLCKKIARGESYLFYEDQKGVKYLFDGEGVPSQFFRKILAKKIGKTSWDWKRFGREKNLLSTLDRLNDIQHKIDNLQSNVVSF